MCACVLICLQMCVYVCICVHVCMFLCVRVYMFPCVCVAGLVGGALASPPACAARCPHVMYLNTFNEMREPKTTPGSQVAARWQVPWGGVCHSHLAAWATFNK